MSDMNAAFLFFPPEYFYFVIRLTKAFSGEN